MWTTLANILKALFIRRKVTEGLPWALFSTLYFGRLARKRGTAEMRVVARELWRLLGLVENEKPRKKGRKKRRK